MSQELFDLDKKMTKNLLKESSAPAPTESQKLFELDKKMTQKLLQESSGSAPPVSQNLFDLDRKMTQKLMQESPTAATATAILNGSPLSYTSHEEPKGQKGSEP